MLHLIPWGKDNAITRQELVNLTGKSDRQVRAEIKRLVREGHPIVSFSNEKGYWQTDSIGEIERFIREADARARSEYLTTEKLRKMVAKANGQRFVTVREHRRRLPATECEDQVMLSAEKII